MTLRFGAFAVLLASVSATGDSCIFARRPDLRVKRLDNRADLFDFCFGELAN